MDSNQKFKALQKEWYNKLKKSGFEDIEQDEVYLKRSSNHAALKVQNAGADYETVLNKREMVYNYYRLAGHFLYDHKFENLFEKYIWERHSNGVSYRDIVTSLKKLGVKVSKGTIMKIVKQLRVLMFTRYKNES